MKVKSKEYFEVNYSFAKPFSQNFEVLIPRSDDINPNLGQKKGPKLVPHVIIVIERWKSKAKETLKWNIRLWNFFLKILKSKPHVVTSSSQNWLKKIQCVHHVQLGVKLFKSFFSEVRILKHRLWRHYCNPSKSP